MSHDYFARKNKHPKVYFKQYISNLEEPLDDISNNSSDIPETMLPESSPIMRRQLRTRAFKLRNHPDIRPRPASEAVYINTQASDEQLRKERQYKEVARTAKLDMAALEMNVVLIKEKINAKRQLLGLPPIVSTTMNKSGRALS